MSAPLEGVRVVELGVMIAVPLAGQALASYGASVVKVEDTGLGDNLRYYGSRKNGMSAWFANANAGKRSLAMDLRSEEGAAILWRLLDEADVLIEGFRPGVMDRLGFGYEAVRSRRPSIVYCSSTGYGPSGPYADRPVFDPLIQALSGWAGGQRVGDRPTLVRGMVADKVGAYQNTQSILAALLRSQRSGEGSYIRNSMLQANLIFCWSDVMMHCSLLDEDAEHLPNVLATYRLLSCRDGFVSCSPGNDAQWRGMCEALEREDVRDDPRFRTAADRGGSLVEWYDVMDDMTGRFGVDEVVARLQRADVPVAKVLRPEEVADDAHVRATGLVAERDHPAAGRLRGPVLALSAFGDEIELGPAPTHGQHTRELLRELAYGDDEIARLAADAVIKG
jgi:crotonobetainyl-CoA:carnitine CoA-transferase CaiB-like acyl-CoA transferase